MLIYLNAIYIRISVSLSYIGNNIKKRSVYFYCLDKIVPIINVLMRGYRLSYFFFAAVIHGIFDQFKNIPICADIDFCSPPRPIGPSVPVYVFLNVRLFKSRIIYMSVALKFGRSAAVFFFHLLPEQFFAFRIR